MLTNTLNAPDVISEALISGQHMPPPPWCLFSDKVTNDYAEDITANSQFFCKVVHAVCNLKGVGELPCQGHARPRVLEHTEQVTLVHVLLYQQEGVVPGGGRSQRSSSGRSNIREGKRNEKGRELQGEKSTIKVNKLNANNL